MKINSDNMDETTRRDINPFDEEFPSEDTKVDKEITGRMRRLTEESGEETREFSDDERISIEPTGLVEIVEKPDPTRVADIYVTDRVKSTEDFHKRDQEDRDRKLEQTKELVGRLAVLEGKDGPVTVDDIREVLPPAALRGVERWQMDKIAYRINQVVRQKYDDRTQLANERRGFIANSPPNEDEQARLDAYSFETAKIDEEYGPARIMKEIGDYLNNPR